MKETGFVNKSDVNISLPVNLCLSVLIIYNHWSSHQLDDLQQQKFRKNWPTDLENRYSKRKYIVQCIKIHAERNNVSLNTAAIQMDSIRTEKGYNTSKYYQCLKDNDIYVTTKRRQKKQKQV